MVAMQNSRPDEACPRGYLYNYDSRLSVDCPTTGADSKSSYNMLDFLHIIFLSPKT
jgi:hypothetical protein